MAHKDTRFFCPFCKSVTWSKDFVGFMLDHDRPQGGVCRKGAEAARKHREKDAK